MNAPAPALPAPRERRIRYIDRPLQRWLLLVVILEIAAAALAVGVLYWRLDAMIEARLYRIHLGPTEPMVPVLLHEGLTLLFYFLAANAVALFAATVIWGRHVGLIVREFDALVDKTVRLDFTPDAAASRQHEVLGLAARWRERERERLSGIAGEIDRLEREHDAGAVQQVLHELRRHLHPTT
jgi:hypothetical protein